MDEPHAATLAVGRTAAVAQLRALAAQLEALPLDAAAEALVLLEPVLDDLRRQAALALERAPRASCYRSGEVPARRISSFDGRVGSSTLRVLSTPVIGRRDGSSTPSCTKTDAWSQ